MNPWIDIKDGVLEPIEANDGALVVVQFISGRYDLYTFTKKGYPNGETKYHLIREGWKHVLWSELLRWRVIDK